jgi:hypothetical protein
LFDDESKPVDRMQSFSFEMRGKSLRFGSIDESVYTSPADTGSNFRIDSCQYMYNLSVNALGIGMHRVDIKINGQVVGSGVFGLK